MKKLKETINKIKNYDHIVDLLEDQRSEIESLKSELAERKPIPLDNDWEIELYEKAEPFGPNTYHIFIYEYWYPYLNGKKEVKTRLFAMAKYDWDQIIERLESRKNEINRIFNKAIDKINERKRTK